MKRITKIIIYTPLISLVLFNLAFILFSLKMDFFWRFRQIIEKDFLGIPLAILFIVLFLLFLFYFVLKKNLLRFFQLVFFVLLLYFIAFNFALFPSLNRINQRNLETFFTLKKDASLDEALDKSWGRFSADIKIYLKLSKMLEHKTLIIPPSSVLHSDYFFHAYVKPKTILIKDYNHLLSEEAFKELNKLEVISYSAFYQLRKIKEYRMIFVSTEPAVFYLFSSGMSMVLVPEDIALQQIAKTHD